MSPRLAAWLREGHEFVRQGHRYFYKDDGQGPTVLLLHGYPTGSYDWHRLWPRLQVRHRLIAPDFLGLGFSDKPLAHAYALTDHAAAVDDLLNALHIGSVHIVAHDLGVRVAQELLARREERMGQAAIASLILLNGAMCPEAYRPRPIQRLLASPLGRWIGPRVPRASFDRAVRDLFGPHTPPSQDLLDDFWTLLEHGGGRRMTHAVGRFWLPRLAMRERLVGALLRSAVPLRVINGAADPNSGRHMVQRLRELSPDVEVISLSQIGHWPQIEDCAATGEAIVQFIQRNPG